MAIHVGDKVTHPESNRTGCVEGIYVNPACLMRYLTIRWDDGEVEEVEELEFGPLED